MEIWQNPQTLFILLYPEAKFRLKICLVLGRESHAWFWEENMPVFELEKKPDLPISF